MRRGLALALCLLTTACSAPQTKAPAPDPAQEAWPSVWRLTGFDSPESVAIGPDKILYVANVGGEGDVHDGNGFISRVTTGGRMLDRQWVRGLDAPKGAIVSGGKLYVSDIDKLVEIDIATGQVTARYPAPGAKFLNDVAVAPDGTVLVADSGAGRILALHGKALTVWAEGPELKSVNGLLPEPGRLLATTMEGKLLAMAYVTKAVTVLATGLGQADGVAPAQGDSYFVGEWPGRLFVVMADGQSKAVVDSRKAGIYINDFIRTGDLLIVPNWKPGSLTAYREMTRMLTRADEPPPPIGLPRDAG